MNFFVKVFLLIVSVAFLMALLLQDDWQNPTRYFSDMDKLSDKAIDQVQSIARTVESKTTGDEGSTTIYKWQDEQGVWHYSNEAQADVKTEVVQIDPNQNVINLKEINKALEKKQANQIPAGGSKK